MSLSSRLLTFFAVTLGVVLVGFSVALYMLVSWQLHSELDDRLETAHQILIASIEVHPSDVEWEPQERAVTLGRDADASQVRWVIRDEAGELIDCSANLGEESVATFPRDGGPWRVRRWRMVAGRFEPQTLDDAGESLPTRASVPLAFDRKARRLEFAIIAGISEAPVQATLGQLAVAMALVSGAIGMVAVLAGRWLCDQALQPVTKMAADARSIRDQPEKSDLLEVPATRDEVAHLAQAFNELLVALREKIEQQKRFAGDASHQLRTPLAAILTTVDVAARRQRDPEEYERVLEVVRRRGNELQQIIELLLTLTRGELPASLSESEPVNLHEWCEQQLRSWRENDRWRDIVLEPAASSVLVRSHSTMLAQVFDNVLDNSLKYSSPGSPVTVRVGHEDGKAVLQVEDRGQGIAAEDLDEVFKPFFRSEQARSTGVPGVGLGLSIAQRLAALLGGRLQVESQLNRGTCFRILLPLAL